MSTVFQTISWAAAQDWFQSAPGTVTTVAAHNAAVVSLAVLGDLLANPELLPTATRTALDLPRSPHFGTDRALAGRAFAVVGRQEPPPYWSSSGPGTAPASAPAWVRDSNVERWRLYGAVQSALQRLAAGVQWNPVEVAARPGATGAIPTDLAAWVTGGVAGVWVTGLALDALRAHESAETDRERVREDGASQRFAQDCARVVRLYMERLQVFRDTGAMPPASAGETPASPYRPVPQVGEDWWKSLVRETGKALALPALGLTAAAVAVILWKAREHAQRETV